MSSASSSDVKLEIGHVLFIDIVGYSKLLITEQREQMQKLREIVGAERICRRGQMNNFIGELKRRTTRLAIPRQDPCFQPLLTKYAASTRGSSL
jgi:hypothetical protein